MTKQQLQKKIHKTDSKHLKLYHAHQPNDKVAITGKQSCYSLSSQNYQIRQKSAQKYMLIQDFMRLTNPIAVDF